MPKYESRPILEDRSPERPSRLELSDTYQMIKRYVEANPQIKENLRKWQEAWPTPSRRVFPESLLRTAMAAPAEFFTPIQGVPIHYAKVRDADATTLGELLTLLEEANQKPRETRYVLLKARPPRTGEDPNLKVNWDFSKLEFAAEGEE
jgi:hypothetical protein